MEFHSVEMSASGRQCHLWVWRVVCPTTKTYYISVHTNTQTHVYVRVYIFVLPHRRRILFEGGQCSGAMVRRVRRRHGAGWFLTHWHWQDWQTGSQMRLLTDWLADWPDITTPTTSFTLHKCMNATKSVNTFYKQILVLRKHLWKSWPNLSFIKW